MKHAHKRNVDPAKQQYINTTNNFQNLEKIELNKVTSYLKIEVEIADHGGGDANFVNAALDGKELSKVRLKRPLIETGRPNEYAFYIEIPQDRKTDELWINIIGWSGMKGEVVSGTITEFK